MPQRRRRRRRRIPPGSEFVLVGFAVQAELEAAVLGTDAADAAADIDHDILVDVDAAAGGIDTLPAAAAVAVDIVDTPAALDPADIDSNSF